MKLGTILSTMENLDAAVATEDELQAAETATEVAEVGGEAVVEETVIDGTDGAIEDAEVAEDKVEELQDIAEASLAADGEQVAEGEVGEQGDGLTPNEAAVIEITHESLMRSLGMPIERRTYTPESFSSKQGRRQATLEALDGLKQSAKKIGESIVAGLKAALNTVINFISGLLRNRSLMEKHLVNLQAKVKAIPSDAKQKSDKVGGGAKMGGNEAAAVQILKEAEGLVAGCVKVADSLKQGADAVKAAIQSGGFNDKALVGGRRLTVEEKEGEYKLIINEETKTGGESQALNPSQMQKLLSMALGVLKSLAAFEKTQNSLKAAVNNILSRLQEAYHSVRSKVGGEAAKAEHAVAGEVKKDARVARSLLGTVGGKIPGAVFGAVKGAADYVTASLNNYKAGAAAEKPAA